MPAHFPFLAMDGHVQVQKFLAMEKEENCDHFYLSFVFLPQDVEKKKVSGEVTQVTYNRNAEGNLKD